MKKTGVLHINGEKMEFSYDGDESSLYQEIAKKALAPEVINSMTFPYKVEATTPDGNVSYKVAQRGSYIENGVTYPSVYVTETRNTVYLPTGTYPKVYLSCIHPESNNYKAYRMEQLPDGSIDAEYGSIDAMANGQGKHVSNPYASSLFWIRYYEKLSKGYKDTSAVFLAPKKAPTRKTVDKATTDANSMLYQQLCEYAHKLVAKTLSNGFEPSYVQVKKCRQIWNKLGTYKTLRAFNKHLQELMILSPRKRDPLHDDVGMYLAHSKDDFKKVLDFEENLILAMEGSLGVNNKNKCVESFKNMGIDVFLATDKQKEEVMHALGTSHLKGMVKNIYRIKPHKQEKAFASYCQKHGISKIKKLWHGSRSENWASIIQNSLLLNPNAPITGKMFGKGIYFAPSPSKSWGYTSYRGSKWANGKSNNAFMGLYAVAYGNPLMVNSSGDYASQIKRSSYNCVHATPANTGLLNDEIVFYDEAAVCLNYLVEFA